MRFFILIILLCIIVFPIIVLYLEYLYKNKIFGILQKFYLKKILKHYENQNFSNGRMLIVEELKSFVRNESDRDLFYLFKCYSNHNECSRELLLYTIEQLTDYELDQILDTWKIKLNDLVYSLILKEDKYILKKISKYKLGSKIDILIYTNYSIICGRLLNTKIFDGKIKTSEFWQMIEKK